MLSDIQADPRLQNTPVIVLTASAVHKAVLQAQDLHVDGFMTKPVSWEQFVEAVKSHAEIVAGGVGPAGGAR